MAVYILTVVVVTLSSLVMPGVLGYEMADIIRALQEREIANAPRSVPDPSEGLVNLFLEVFDADNDGKVALSEVRSVIDHVLQINGGPPEYIAEQTGFGMTLATAIDSDADSFIEREEIHRLTSTLMREAGVSQVGKLMGSALWINYGLPGRFPAADANLIFPGLDRNHDGVLSADEREVLYASRYASEAVVSTANDADANDDGNLNRSEARAWIAAMDALPPYVARPLYIYGQIVSRAGKDAADAWARA